MLILGQGEAGKSWTDGMQEVRMGRIEISRDTETNPRIITMKWYTE